MSRASLLSASIVLCLAVAVTAAPAGAAPPQVGASGLSDRCGQCHDPTDVVGEGLSLAIEGVPEVFVQGHRYNITVVLDRGTGPRPHFAISQGFQMGVNGGTLGSTAGTISISDQEVGSNGAVADNIWSVIWTAPHTYERVTFYAAAVVADGDGTEAGDLWVRTTVTSYAPLDVPSEEPAGPWPYTLAFLLLAAATVLLVGYVIVVTHRRPPPMERD